METVPDEKTKEDHKEEEDQKLMNKEENEEIKIALENKEEENCEKRMENTNNNNTKVEEKKTVNMDDIRTSNNNNNNNDDDDTNNNVVVNVKDEKKKEIIITNNSLEDTSSSSCTNETKKDKKEEKDNEEKDNEEEQTACPPLDNGQEVKNISRDKTNEKEKLEEVKEEKEPSFNKEDVSIEKRNDDKQKEVEEDQEETSLFQELSIRPLKKKKKKGKQKKHKTTKIQINISNEFWKNEKKQQEHQIQSTPKTSTSSGNNSIANPDTSSSSTSPLSSAAATVEDPDENVVTDNTTTAISLSATPSPESSSSSHKNNHNDTQKKISFSSSEQVTVMMMTVNKKKKKHKKKKRKLSLTTTTTTTPDSSNSPDSTFSSACHKRYQQRINHVAPTILMNDNDDIRNPYIHSQGKKSKAFFYDSIPTLVDDYDDVTNTIETMDNYYTECNNELDHLTTVMGRTINRNDQDPQDPLQFYGETHEDQDPLFQKFAQEKEQRQYQEALAVWQKEVKEKRRQKLEQMLQEKWKTQEVHFEKQCQKLRTETKSKFSLREEQLTQRWIALQKNELAKFQKNKEFLLNTQQNDHKLLEAEHHKIQQHIKSLSQSQQPQQQMTLLMEWQKKDSDMREKHKKDLESMEQKEVASRKKIQNDLKLKMAELTVHHDKRTIELEETISKLQSKIKQHTIQQRQLYLQYHEQQMANQHKDICKKFNQPFPPPNNDNKNSSSTKTTSINSKTEPSIQNGVKQHGIATANNNENMINHSGDAVIRQKRRKTVMNSSNHHLAIEIHNEGIMILHRGGIADKTTTQKTNNNKHNAANTNQGDKSPIAVKEEHNGQNRSMTSRLGKATPLSLFGKHEDFIPWGVQATKILLSVVCGVVPNGYGCDLVNMESASSSSRQSSSHHLLQGGQMKCVITDMRTSDETAIFQRLQALKQVEINNKITPRIKDLESKLKSMDKELLDKQNAVNKANNEKSKITALAKQEVEKSDKVRRGLEDIKRKTTKFYNPDGSLNRNTTTPETIQKYKAAESKFKHLDEKFLKRAMQVKKKMKEIQDNVVRTNSALKRAQKEKNTLDTEMRKNLYLLKKIRDDKDDEYFLKYYNLYYGNNHTSNNKKNTNKTKGAKTNTIPDIKFEEGACRNQMEDVMSIIHMVSEQRRMQLQTKRNNNDKNWDNALSGVSEIFKNILKTKMQRRRLAIILRPTWTSIMNQIEEIATNKMSLSSLSDKYQAQSDSHEMLKKKRQEKREFMRRTEQLLLLALHPPAPKPRLPSVPKSTNSAYTEPWAEPGWHVVHEVYDGDQFFQSNLSDCSSAPGRQAASFLTSCHLRCLTAPLTNISRASAPAELYPSVTPKISPEMMGLDPFATSEKTNDTITKNTVQYIKSIISNKGRNDDAKNVKKRGAVEIKRKNVVNKKQRIEPKTKEPATSARMNNNGTSTGFDITDDIPSVHNNKANNKYDKINNSKNQAALMESDIINSTGNPYMGDDGKKHNNHSLSNHQAQQLQNNSHLEQRQQLMKMKSTSNHASMTNTTYATQTPLSVPIMNPVSRPGRLYNPNDGGNRMNHHNDSGNSSAYKNPMSQNSKSVVSPLSPSPIGGNNSTNLSSIYGVQANSNNPSNSSHNPSNHHAQQKVEQHQQYNHYLNNQQQQMSQVNPSQQQQQQQQQTFQQQQQHQQQQQQQQPYHPHHFHSQQQQQQQHQFPNLQHQQQMQQINLYRQQQVQTRKQQQPNGGFGPLHAPPLPMNPNNNLQTNQMSHFMNSKAPSMTTPYNNSIQQQQLPTSQQQQSQHSYQNSRAQSSLQPLHSQGMPGSMRNTMQQRSKPNTSSSLPQRIKTTEEEEALNDPLLMLFDGDF